MIIRRAEERDIAAVKRLLLQVNQVHADGRPDLFISGGIKYTDEELRRIFSDDMTPVFVYEDEKCGISGYCFGIYEIVPETSTSLQPRKTFYIDDLCVDQAARGKHVGTALYEHVLQEAKKNGCYDVTLHVWELNPGARSFYEKMGLVPRCTTMEKIL